MNDPEERALVTVYRHRRKRTYFFQPQAYQRKTGFLMEMGEPVAISSTEDAARIATVLEQGLRLFNDPSLQPITLSAQDDAKFRRNHDAVAVRRYPDGSTEVEPRQSVKGGYKGMPQEKIVLGPGASSDDVAAALDEAFRRAG